MIKNQGNRDSKTIREEKNDTEITNSEHVTKSGEPDFRFAENRNDPEKVAEYIEKKEAQNVAESPPINKDGSPDLRRKENLDLRSEIAGKQNR